MAKISLFDAFIPRKLDRHVRGLDDRKRHDDEYGYYGRAPRAVRRSGYGSAYGQEDLGYYSDEGMYHPSNRGTRGSAGPDLCAPPSSHRGPSMGFNFERGGSVHASRHGGMSGFRMEPLPGGGGYSVPVPYAHPSQPGGHTSPHVVRHPSQSAGRHSSPHVSQYPREHSSRHGVSAHDFANQAPNHPAPQQPQQQYQQSQQPQQHQSRVRTGKLPEGAPLPAGVRDPLATVSEPKPFGHFGQREHVPGMSKLNPERHGRADDPKANWYVQDEIRKLKEELERGGGGGGSGRRSGRHGRH